MKSCNARMFTNIAVWVAKRYNIKLQEVSAAPPRILHYKFGGPMSRADIRKDFIYKPRL